MAKRSTRERPSLAARQAKSLRKPSPRAKQSPARSVQQNKPTRLTKHSPGTHASMLALGIDITEVSRIEQMVIEHGQRFLTRVFTAKELADAGEGKGKHMHLAARFAAKEAAMKALGTGLASGITWQDVETRRTATGAPQLLLHGRAKTIAAERAIQSWVISLTHTKTTAVAVVIGTVGQ